MPLAAALAAQSRAEPRHRHNVGISARVEDPKVVQPRPRHHAARVGTPFSRMLPKVMAVGFCMQKNKKGRPEPALIWWSCLLVNGETSPFPLLIVHITMPCI